MTLALDLGNSALKAACFVGDDLVDARRFKTALPGWTDAFTHWLDEVGTVERVGIASVVPALLPALIEQMPDLPPPVVIRATQPLPLRMAYATPATLGADRIAAAVAAWNHTGRSGPVVALDAGTAITYEVVRADGVYAGGTIAPGPRLLVESLRLGTAQLPKVPFELPPSPVGESTLRALQSGLAFGFLDAVAGMLARLRRELGPKTQVVATGGWAGWLVEQEIAVDAVRPHLVLEGVRDILRWMDGGR